MRTYLESIKIQDLVDSNSSCEAQTNMLEKIVNNGMDIVLPMRSKTIVASEPPWINQALKKMIRARQKALAEGDLATF